ncbi:hypothetical protein [Streptomyces sp. SID14515]|uniref:hypothetical protein n=1 Tax=Streptomyces sp. SID14515 TaxID=2706074 RepID=UPI0013CAF817|nr:hypothetical protein [Streptomyces sp. SID14515]NEB42514.1 hypothetical protein [Streptomyces sp. SID14515]
MNLTAMIAKAQEVLAEHGDIPVVVPDTGCGCCRSFTYDPAELEVERDVTSWDYSTQDDREVAIAFVVRG